MATTCFQLLFDLAVYEDNRNLYGPFLLAFALQTGTLNRQWLLRQHLDHLQQESASLYIGPEGNGQMQCHCNLHNPIDHEVPIRPKIGLIN